MAVGFEASLGLSSCVGYDETVSQKKVCLVGFFSFFLCSIFIYQAVVAELRVKWILNVQYCCLEC